MEHNIQTILKLILKKEEEAMLEFLMPLGLLNKLSREEILDLIAYVYARGDKSNSLFAHEHEHGDKK